MEDAAPCLPYPARSMARQLTALIMAAGHGTRMRSTLPKVLHPICGRPMVDWVVAAARESGTGRIVAITRPGEGVAEGIVEGVEVAEQTVGEGTGSAVLAARSAIERSDTVLVLSGDHPLVSSGLIVGLLDAHERENAAATLLTTDRLDPTAYGRIVRAPDGSVEQIVETKSTEGLAAEVLALREINIGLYAFAAEPLLRALDAVGETGGERYLTGVFPIMREWGLHVAAHATDDVLSAMGVNTRGDLMEVARVAQRRILHAHATAGVTIVAPDSVAVDAEVTIGPDTTLWPGVTLRGRTAVGGGCQLGPQTTVTDSVLGDSVSAPHSFITGARIADGASVGPFAYLRPEADIGEGAKVGTFVEVKKSRIGAGAKVPHLSYVGDAEVGAGANLGAGAITANYDGRDKHRTVIGEGARTSVHTSFVAPVRVGARAYTGAGSVITEDVPDGALGIARARQTNIEGYAERKGSKRE
ncbi:MAG: bifunctional UDP-N-acetylglucosamine diphosphorylase/glucosamine-1-phosphate N-acetyltransferase GlmU [Thermoleophilaceae bacterium]